MLLFSTGWYYLPRLRVYGLVEPEALRLEHEPASREGDRPVYLGRFAVDPRGRQIAVHSEQVYVATLEELISYSPEGKQLQRVALDATLAPGSLAVAEDRALLLDTHSRMILAFSLEGKFLFRFPLREKGEASGERRVKEPTGLWVTDNLLVYVSDAGDGKVKVFDWNGHFLYEYASPRQGPPGEVLVTDDGRTVLVNQGEKEIHVFSCKGDYVYDFDRRGVVLQERGAITKDSLGRIMLLDRGRGDVVTFTWNGHYLFRFGGNKLKAPADIWADKEKRVLYVLDPRQGQVLVWGY